MYRVLVDVFGDDVPRIRLETQTAAIVRAVTRAQLEAADVLQVRVQRDDEEIGCYVNPLYGGGLPPCGDDGLHHP